MNQSDLTKVAFEISASLAALNANMEQVLSKMADHENRLHLLEQYRPIEDDTSLTDSQNPQLQGQQSSGA